MPAPRTNRQSGTMEPRAESMPEAGPTAPAEGELPSRQGLIARLETQRTELLRAMSCVNLARRTIEPHVVDVPVGSMGPVTPRQHQGYRQRVVEALNDASEALGTAYPMLERIAQALAIEEILREHTPVERTPTSAHSRTPALDRSAATKR